MSYDNEIIRDIADVANRKTPRKLAIADSQKVTNISLDTLKTTAGELGLTYVEVLGRGEDAEDNVFLIVASDRPTQNEWELELQYNYLADLAPKERMRFQIRMGQALGYTSREIIDFLPTEVAKSCPCTCYGGTPQ